jgi:hypothetical protein
MTGEDSMNDRSVFEKIETAGLEVQTASIPVNTPDHDVKLSKEQLTSALRLWSLGDKRIVPDFVDTKIIEESGNEIIKEVLHHGKSSMKDGSPNLQRTSLRGDNLMLTEYLAGPWFMAIAGFEETEDGDIHFLLTTIRHKQHVDYLAPAEAAKKAGANKPPPTTKENAKRVLGIFRDLALSNQL